MRVRGGGQRQAVGLREWGNELVGSIKCGEFLDWMTKCVSFSGRTVFPGTSRLVILFDVGMRNLRLSRNFLFRQCEP
jgi:hypothetical protein